MSDQTWQSSSLDILREAVEGGQPGQPTSFLDGTKADGSGNNGLFATLASLSAAQASDPTVLGVSVAAQAAHTAFHMEVAVRWTNGERGPFDWQGSFSPATVTENEWTQLQARVQGAYAALVELARRPDDWEDEGDVIASLAHVTYHLGSIRQIIKLV
jgi:hypothetical protein